MDYRYIPRKIDEALLDWKKDASRLPIILNGARQVGKTEAIRHFAQTSYGNFIEINFVEQPEYKGILLDGYSTEAIIRRISMINPSLRFEAGKTLLFFDEIQEFPDIATSLKFFKQDGRFDVILSGSLLGVHYKSVSSISVGYKTDIRMHSLDFEEFLRALGYGDDFIERIYGHMVEAKSFDSLEMKVLSDKFMDFCVLGGMPRVVAMYLEKGTFEGSLAAQREILEDYRADVRKYAEGLDQARILNVYDSIAAQLAKENKKFQVTKVARGARFGDYRGCVEWLNDAGIINLCYALHFPCLPIKGNYEAKLFKIYMADTGLLVAQLDDESQMDLRANRDLGVYKGGLYENIVADALAKQDYPLAYYKRSDSTLEEDFFVRTANCLVPVEVKARGGCAQSLRSLIRSEHYPDVRWGLKLHGGNIGWEDSVLSLPYFTTFLLRRFIAEYGEAIESGKYPSRHI